MAKNSDNSVRVKLQIPAGQANPSPPVGPMLGQAGLNIMEFCKAFNAETQNEEPGAPIPVEILVNRDKSFTFTTRKPPVSHFLKKAARVPKGSGAAGRDAAGRVTEAQCREIAQAKMENLNAQDLEAATRMVKGTARSMGLEVAG